MLYKCNKCNGTGKVPYNHIKNGICFDCNGYGKIKYNYNQDRLNKLKIDLTQLEKKEKYYDNQFESLMLKLKKAVTNNKKRPEMIKKINDIAVECEYYADKVKEFKEVIRKESS